MSHATDLHDEIMQVVMAKMKNKEVGYADIFGALATAKAFFEVEYAGRLSATWKEVIAEEQQK